MKKIKLMLVAFMAMLGMDAFAQAGLSEGAEQTKDGIRYEVTSVYKTEAEGKPNTVTASLNGFSGATITIPDDITFHVKGKDNDNVDIDDDVTFKVTAVGSFANLASATAISVGANVATINAGAFIGTKIASLDLSGTKVTSIARWFTANADGKRENTTLLSVSLPACATGVVADAFNGCSGLATVTFADLADGADNLATNGIAAGAFSGTAITTLDLTKTKILTLNKLFEDNNAKLTTVKLPATLTGIGPNALEKCGVLSTVDLSLCTKLVKIGSAAFGTTPSLTTLDFSKCESLQYFTTNGVSGDAQNGTADVTPFISGGAANTFLTTLTLNVTKDKETKYIGTALANCKALATVNIAATKIEKLNDASLAGLDAITELEIPATCWNIGETGKAGLTKLTIKNTGEAAGTPLTLVPTSFTMATNADSEITLGNITYAAISDGAIVGPTTAGKGATVTVGDIAATADLSAAAALVSEKVKSFTIGAIAATTNDFNAEFFGQAAKITFGGNITITAATTAIIAPTTPNDALTEIAFGTIKIDEGAFADEVFDDTNAPLLAKMAWNPATADAKEAFSDKTFAATAAGTRAKKVAFSTTEDVAALYPAAADLCGVAITMAEVALNAIEVANNGTGSWYYGKFYNLTTDAKIAIKQGDATVIVYAAYVNSTEPTKVYYEQLKVIDGYYYIPRDEAVIVKSNGSADVEVSKDFDGKDSMPYEYNSMVSHNEIDYEAGSILGAVLNSTAYTGDADHVLYAMAKPAKWNLAFKTVDNTASLTNVFYLIAPKAAAGRLQNIWLDGSEPNDEATAIKKVEAEVENGAIYNLQGVRVNTAKKGLYIQNGKKFIVK